MAMPVTVPRYTNTDLVAFPQNGNRYELVDGVLLVTPGPAPLHEVVVSNLVQLLQRYLDGRGFVFIGGTVEVGPNYHLEPDLLVIPARAFPGGIDRGTRRTAVTDWWLAVEVSGAGSRIYDRDFKSPAAYPALGVVDVWRMDLDERGLYRRQADMQVPQRIEERFVWQAQGCDEAAEIEVPGLFRSL